MLVDPAWRPREPGEAPPDDAIMGRWTTTDGQRDLFVANPAFVARDPEAGTDPVDAAARMARAGDLGSDEVLAVLGECQLELAVDGHEQPLVSTTGDGRRVQLVASSPPHRVAGRWQPVDPFDLAIALPDGVDVLLNPGGTAPLVLAGDQVRRALAASDDRRQQTLARLSDLHRPTAESDLRRGSLG